MISERIEKFLLASLSCFAIVAMVAQDARLSVAPTLEVYCLIYMAFCVAFKLLLALLEHAGVIAKAPKKNAAEDYDPTYPLPNPELAAIAEPYVPPGPVLEPSPRPPQDEPKSLQPRRNAKLVPDFPPKPKPSDLPTPLLDFALKGGVIPIKGGAGPSIATWAVGAKGKSDIDTA